MSDTKIETQKDLSDKLTNEGSEGLLRELQAEAGGQGTEGEEGMAGTMTESGSDAATDLDQMAKAMDLPVDDLEHPTERNLKALIEK